MSILVLLRSQKWGHSVLWYEGATAEREATVLFSDNWVAVDSVWLIFSSPITSWNSLELGEDTREMHCV